MFLLQILFISNMVKEKKSPSQVASLTLLMLYILNYQGIPSVYAVQTCSLVWAVARGGYSENMENWGSEKE